MKGTIKWYNPRKGYGFILGEDGKEIFVHYTALPDDTEINENDKVDYQVEESDRGPKAAKVKLLELD